MKRIVIIYGIIAGAIAIGGVVLGQEITGSEKSMQALELLGYLVMLVALSVIFVGIRQYRNHELGGVITFGKAALIGVGVAAVAGGIYVAVWEVYLSVTDHAFINDYTESVIAAKSAAGLSGEELETVVTKMETMRIDYANPLYRLPMTFLEIFPIGLIIALISAAVLRNSNVMPAKVD